MIDKADGGKVKRKVAEIKDTVKENLNHVNDGKADNVEEKVKAELKKRKLLEEVTEKIYMIKKGPNFSKSEQNIAKFSSRWVSPKCQQTTTLRAVSGILTRFSSLSSILLGTPMTPFSSATPQTA